MLENIIPNLLSEKLLLAVKKNEDIAIFKNQLGKDIRGYCIKYKPYSWEEELDNFVD